MSFTLFWKNTETEITNKSLFADTTQHLRLKNIINVNVISSVGKHMIVPIKSLLCLLTNS